MAEHDIGSLFQGSELQEVTEIFGTSTIIVFVGNKQIIKLFFIAHYKICIFVIEVC
jgi:hypothetical protein